MNFCKKISISFLILLISLISTGCDATMKKVVFKRDSVYDTFQNSTTEDAKPRRVGNVVYMGSESSSSQSGSDGGPSFEFENLRR